MQIPIDLENEINQFVKIVNQKEFLLDTRYVRCKYKKHVKKFISNPFDKTVSKIIIRFLKKNKPMSVIRLGDGEMNLLSLSYYKQFPKISNYAADYSVRAQSHSFNVSKSGLFLLEQMMMTAVKEADIVGTLGHWRPKDEPIKAKSFFSKLQRNQNLRAMWGHWTGIDFVLDLHSTGFFKNKVLTSAHLYFSVLKNLSLIFKYVSVVYLITDQHEVKHLLEQKYKENTFHLIKEPSTGRPLLNNDAVFLENIMQKLPSNMKGTLTLIGAGIWSEYYSTWIKRRGGVAVDLGSGFDLLLNKKNRRIHQNVDFKL